MNDQVKYVTAKIQNLSRGNVFVHTRHRTETLPAKESAEADFSEGEIVSMSKNPNLLVTVGDEIVSIRPKAETAQVEEPSRPVWGEGQNEAGAKGEVADKPKQGKAKNAET